MAAIQTTAGRGRVLSYKDDPQQVPHVVYLHRKGSDAEIWALPNSAVRCAGCTFPNSVHSRLDRLEERVAELNSLVDGQLSV